MVSTIDGTLIRTTTPGQSRRGSNGNIPHTPRQELHHEMYSNVISRTQNSFEYCSLILIILFTINQVECCSSHDHCRCRVTNCSATKFPSSSIASRHPQPIWGVFYRSSVGTYNDPIRQVNFILITTFLRIYIYIYSTPPHQ